MKFVQSAGWVLAFGLLVGCSAGAPDASTSLGVESQSAELRPLQLCEGPLHLTCAKSQYCSATGRSHCPGPKNVGICATRPDLCTDLFDPVCGCDGETYSNSCFAAAVGVAVDHSGACAAKPPFCGGIAGIPCPGLGKCIDDPSDDCDPKAGGADCGGLCTCVQNVLCIRGSHFNSDPKVCSCVPDVPVCVQKVLCIRGSHFDNNPKVCGCVPDVAAN